MKTVLRFEIKLVETDVSYLVEFRSTSVMIPSLDDLHFTLEINASYICWRSIATDHDQ